MCFGTGALHGYLGDKDADWLIEWIETSRLLGIGHFHLTNSSALVSDRMRRVLEYYEQTGERKGYFFQTWNSIRSRANE